MTHGATHRDGDPLLLRSVLTVVLALLALAGCNLGGWEHSGPAGTVSMTLGSAACDKLAHVEAIHAIHVHFAPALEVAGSDPLEEVIFERAELLAHCAGGDEQPLLRVSGVPVGEYGAWAVARDGDGRVVGTAHSQEVPSEFRVAHGETAVVGLLLRPPLPVHIAEFSASKRLVPAGATVALLWDTTSAQSCTIDPGALAATPADFGLLDVEVSGKTTFRLNCDGLEGPVERTTEVEVADEDWAQVAAGEAHTCAIKTDGRLFCWGEGSEGQLGNDSTGNSLVPVREFTEASDWAQVTAGSAHTCAVKTDGRLFCWGGGRGELRGQLGNNSTGNSLVPVQEFTEASDWAQVAAGSAHTCAVKTDGRLFCWGDAYLDNDSTGHNLVPVQEVTEASDWAQVAAGGTHTCAVKTDGRLFCWGMGAFGQLGNDSTDHSPVPVQESTAASDWAQVAAGGTYTCAVKTDGRLFCWGDAYLGNDSTGRTLAPVQEVTGASDWAQVARGDTHTCAVKMDGRLFCWGGGYLGNDDSTGHSLVPVQEFTEASDWAQVAAGGGHTCAVKANGQSFCWGSAAYGRLGNNFNNLVPEQEGTAAPDWAQVTAGTNYVCAVKMDGRLFCWGHGALGQLGNDSTDHSPAPVQESTAANDWTQVAAGDRHTCAVKTDGRLFCWGHGANGRLGNDSTAQSLAPVQESTTASDWVQVAAGDRHTCAVKTNGSLFCWGEGTNGRLGNNSTIQRLLPVQESTAATDWAQVSAGGHHTCAVKTDGRLFCWGLSADGQLGHDSPMPSYVPVQEFTAASDWARVSAGSRHTCAVKTDGQLFCWGQGGAGRLGNNSGAESLVPVQEFTATANWRGVEAGHAHTCSTKTDGRLFCWGSGTYGQLGLGSMLGPVWPTPVEQDETPQE